MRYTWAVLRFLVTSATQHIALIVDSTGGVRDVLVAAPNSADYRGIFNEHFQ